MQQPRQTMRAAGSRVFRSAARHSRLVRFLRYAIPAVILLIAAIIFAATYFRDKVPIIDFGPITWSPTSIRMELPRVKGFTTDQRPYELTAQAAVQDLAKLDVLMLQELGAKVELKDGQQVNITSVNGVYDTKAEVLRLKDHITIKSTSGYEGSLSEATVHISSGNIISESPVEVRLPSGLLTANRLEVRDNGAVIKFSGGVEMSLNPEQMRQMTERATPDTADAIAPMPAAPLQPAAPAVSVQTTQRRGATSP